MKYWYRILVLAATFAAIAFAPGAAAQAYPTKPITIIVPFSAGAGTDVIARVLAKQLSLRTGQPVLVENRTGAAGVIGTDLVARAPADGYTLLFTPSSFSFAQLVVKTSGGYDALRDFVPVIEVGEAPMFLVTGGDSGFKTFKDVVAAAKTKRLEYGSAGTGSILHIVGEVVNKETGINLLHIPYKGVAPAITDVLGGQIHFAYGSLSTIKPYLASGKLVALAVVSRTRTPLEPEVPSLYELGYKGVDLTSWYGIFAPKGTPPAAVTVLNENLNAILKMPEVMQIMAVQGATTVGGSPDVLDKTNRQNVEQISQVIKALGLSPQ